MEFERKSRKSNEARFKKEAILFADIPYTEMELLQGNTTSTKPWLEGGNRREFHSSNVREPAEQGVEKRRNSRTL